MSKFYFSIVQFPFGLLLTKSDFLCIFFLFNCLIFEGTDTVVRESQKNSFKLKGEDIWGRLWQRPNYNATKEG